MTSRIGIIYREARNTVKYRLRAPAPGETVIAPEWVAPGRIENFLTEMLGLAVLVDWRPMAALMSGIDIIDGSQPIAGLHPCTQQHLVRGCDLSDRARLDLVLAVDGDHGNSREVWVEVKAGSPFSGDQIQRYLTAMREAEDAVCRRLVVLGQWHVSLDHRHEDGAPIQTRTWADLVAIAAQASPIWQDFALFLAEQRIVDTQSHDVTGALPVDWLADAIAEALVPPIAWCNWHAGRDFHSTRRSVLARLTKHEREGQRRFVQRWAPGQFTFIELGAVDDPRCLSARLAVSRDYPIPHEVLRRRAQQSRLVESGWRLGAGRDDAVILGKSQPFATHDAAAEAGRWLRDQLTALRDAGVLLDLNGDGRPL